MECGVYFLSSWLYCCCLVMKFFLICVGMNYGGCRCVYESCVYYVFFIDRKVVVL